jgi:biopolymer transport protein TolR
VARKKITSLETMSEINMTPLMDLTFILLITFIITFPLIENGIPVNLPTADGKPVESDAKSYSLTIDEKGVIFLDDQRMGIEELQAALSVPAKNDPDLVVMIRGDQRIVYGKMIEVMHALHKVNITKLQLVTAKGEAE